ncbi:hypothetical protein JCM16358_19320 [Halanaerocella petrolearia]
MDKIMIIGVGWEQLPLLSKAKELDLEVIATTTWDKTEIEADEVYEVEPRNLNRLEEIFSSENPDAVIADECDYSMYAVAYLTDKYNLPGPGLKPLSITNDKSLQRKICEDTSVCQPDYKLCWNFKMVLEVAQEIGYPVILKPIDNRGSIGVSVANNKQELSEAWFKAISNSHSRKCIVEDYIEGEMIAVDGFHDSYEFSGLCISTKEEYSEFRNLDKLLYFPGEITNQRKNKILNLNKEIIKTVGIEFGFVHAEYKIEKETGNIYLIEIANRGGGVYISEKILSEITGLDLKKKFILMSLGEKVKIDFDNEYKSKVLMYFLDPKGQASPQAIKENYKEDILALYMKDKSKIENVDSKDALGRAGVVILTGDSFVELKKEAREIESEINVVNTEYFWRE